MKRIDDLRVVRRMSVRGLSAKANMSANYYYKRLRGDLSLTLDDVEALAAAMDVSPFELTDRAALMVEVGESHEGR